MGMRLQKNNGMRGTQGQADRLFMITKDPTPSEAAQERHSWVITELLGQRLSHLQNRSVRIEWSTG